MIPVTEKKVRRKRNLQIKPIPISEKDLQELKVLFASRFHATTYKRWRIRKKLGGLCVICKEVPAHTLSYPAAGCTIVERYSEACLRKDNYL